MNIEYTASVNNSAVKDCTFYQDIKKTLYVYWFNTSYAHLDQIRVDFEMSYKGQQEFVRMKDDGIIDTMWIPAEGSDHVNDTPTVMFCNPNGVFYENFAYDSYWMEFYTENKFNIFLWNYRGYGRSKGTISPDNLFSDADELVRHLEEVRGVSKLLVHGISLGGGVACHLSNNSHVDAVFADRTFSSLDSVTRDDFGKYCRIAFNILTLGRWKMHCARKFLKSNTYKIISSDPRDEMIPEMASLKNGVSREAFKADIMSRKSNKKEINFFDVGTAMGSKDTEALFELLREIFTLNINKASDAYLKAKSKLNSKKKKDDNQINESIELNFLGSESDSINRSGNFDISGTNYSAHSETFLDRTTGNVNLEDVASQYQSWYKTLNPASDVNLEQHLVKYYVPEDEGRIDDFLSKIKRTLCKLDSAGCTFHHIFASKSREKSFRMFKQFLANLEIWGSYQNLPLNKDGIFDPADAKKSSELQIIHILDSLLDIFKETSIDHYPFLKSLVEKAGSAGFYLSKIQSCDISKKGKLDSNPLDLVQDDEIKEEDLDSNSEKQSFITADISKSALDDEESNLVDSSQLSHAKLSKVSALGLRKILIVNRCQKSDS